MYGCQLAELNAADWGVFASDQAVVSIADDRSVVENSMSTEPPNHAKPRPSKRVMAQKLATRNSDSIPTQEGVS